MPLEQQFGPISHWKIRVRSHNTSHNFPRENDPKIRPANPPYKEPVARKKQGQRFTKNDHWGHTKLMHGPKKMQPGHTCRQQRQNSLAFSQTTVFRSQQQSTIFKSPVISSVIAECPFAAIELDTSMGSGQQIKSNTTQTKRKAKPPLCFQSMHLKANYSASLVENRFWRQTIVCTGNKP